MSQINEFQMVELFWIKDGVERKAIFPADKAEKFLSKHLIPQKESGILSEVGIKII